MGRLEPAGVDLQAKGFKEYLRNLEQIEKKQRAVFDQKFKGTDRSFAQVEKAAKDYERQLEQTRRQQERFRRDQERLAATQRKAAAAQRAQTAAQRAQTAAQRRQAAGGLLQAGGGRLGGGLGSLVGGFGAVGIATAAVSAVAALKTISKESALAADAFNTQEAAFGNLASAYGQSSTLIRNAVREASKGVLSETDIINAANKSLLLGVARTPEEFARVTRAALVLGRTVGLDASQAIERFTTGLGRQSKLIIDDFGLSTEELNRKLEQISQRDFGLSFDGLSDGQKKAAFLEATLTLADEKLADIGESTETAASDFARLEASSENLKIAFGQLTLPLEQGLARTRTELNETLTSFLTLVSGQAGIDTEIAEINRQLERAIAIRDELAAGETIGARFAQFLGTAEGKTEQVNAKIAELESLLASLKTQQLEEIGDEMGIASDKTDEFNDSLETTERNLNALTSALAQAERLQISFGRAAEDATRKLERQQAKLARTQARDRDKLLIRQQKDLDKFEASRLKDLENFEKDRASKIAQAEKDIAKAREQAADDRLAAQKRLQLQLRQNEERFRLSQVQSERRFQLSDRRLRAEGDILALQELRENRALEVQEAQENFALQQRQTKEGEKQISDDRIREQQERLQELKANLDQERKELEISLEDQRAELLAGFDEQLREQQIAQEEQRADLLRNFAEQQEDRRINQARQLEDLGRSLADQEDLTEQGARDIADELEKVFGSDGVADTIFQGFSSRTESEFRNLFDTVSNITRSIPLGLGRGRGSTPRGTGSSIDRPLQFQEGGVVPGPIGAPQAAIVHGGETILPTHTMAAPVIPSQRVSVDMSGGFNISGGEQAGEIAVQAALDEMTTSFEIAVRRLIRRG